MSTFSVRERVSIASGSNAGLTGFVTEVRRYPDGFFRYGVGSWDGDSPDVSGIYDEAQLISIGELIPRDEFRLPRGLRPGDVVEILPPHEQAGDLMVVDDSLAYLDDEDNVWITIVDRDFEEWDSIEIRHVKRTGKSVKIQDPRGPVYEGNADGVTVGNVLAFDVLDDIRAHL